jgi:hypothetical protein
MQGGACARACLQEPTVRVFNELTMLLLFKFILFLLPKCMHKTVT